MYTNNYCRKIHVSRIHPINFCQWWRNWREKEEEEEEEKEGKKESFCCYFSCEYELSKSQLTMGQGDFFSRQTETKKAFLLSFVSDMSCIWPSPALREWHGGKEFTGHSFEPSRTQTLQRVKGWIWGEKHKREASLDKVIERQGVPLTTKCDLVTLTTFNDQFLCYIDLVFYTQSGSFTGTLVKDCVYWHRMLNKIPDSPNSAIYVRQLHRYFNWSPLEKKISSGILNNACFHCSWKSVLVLAPPSEKLSQCAPRYIEEALKNTVW